MKKIYSIAEINNIVKDNKFKPNNKNKFIFSLIRSGGAPETLPNDSYSNTCYSGYCHTTGSSNITF